MGIHLEPARDWDFGKPDIWPWHDGYRHCRNGSSEIQLAALKNPFEFATVAARIIKTKLADLAELRHDEAHKIRCGERHFRDAPGVDYRVVTDASKLK